jgi:bacteriocin-like protein
LDDPRWLELEKSMSNDAATSEQVPEPSRELAEDELAQVSGGIIAVLIGLSAPYEPPVRPIKPGPPV